MTIIPRYLVWDKDRDGKDTPRIEPQSDGNKYKNCDEVTFTACIMEKDGTIKLDGDIEIEYSLPEGKSLSCTITKGEEDKHCCTTDKYKMPDKTGEHTITVKAKSRCYMPAPLTKEMRVTIEERKIKEVTIEPLSATAKTGQTVSYKACAKNESAGKNGIEGASASTGMGGSCTTDKTGCCSVQVTAESAGDYPVYASVEAKCYEPKPKKSEKPATLKVVK